MTANQNPTRWMRRNEAATYARVSPSTISTWQEMGLLHVKIGGVVRYRQDWIDEFLTENAVALSTPQAIAEEAVADILGGKGR